MATSDAQPWTEAMVSALTQNSTDIISLLDAQGRLLYNSPATERTNGFKPEELAGLDTFDFIHPDDREEVARVFQALVAAPGSTHTVQYRYRTRSGDWLWMEAVACNQLDNPAVRGIVANSRDISERRRMEEQRLAHRHLESLSALAGGIAHDFNNLLSVVMGEATLLADSTPEQVREAALNIEAAARKAADLTQLLLACAGKGRFTRAPLSLPALMSELEPELRATVAANTSLVVTVDPDTPSIEAASERLRQVVMNLVLNASQALTSAGGRVEVRVGHGVLDRAALEACTQVHGLEPGPMVFIEVSDTGKGMTAETRQHLFEPYFTTGQVGRGLGLAAVAGIVRGFRGAIDVRSAPDQGTTVTVWFASSKAGAKADEPREAWRGEGAVLVVDDEPQTARVACRLLGSMGFETDTAMDGQDALERFGPALSRFRLVLLDVVMPRLDGPQTFSRLRALRPDLPVVFYSGYDAGLHETGPGTAFLQKPFTRSSMESCLRQVLGAAARVHG